MEAYRVIISYLATGTIIQLCFIYACTANFRDLWWDNPSHMENHIKYMSSFMSL